MVNFVSAVAGIIAAFFSAMVYILMIRKTTIVLTFSNNKDAIEYPAGQKSRMWFFLRNKGHKVTANNVQAVIYFPDDLKPEIFGGPERRKEVQYFWEQKPGRVVFYVDALPPKSYSVRRGINPVKFPSEPQRYEFRYGILGDRVRKTEGKLIVQTRSQV